MGGCGSLPHVTYATHLKEPSSSSELLVWACFALVLLRDSLVLSSPAAFLALTLLVFGAGLSLSGMKLWDSETMKVFFNEWSRFGYHVGNATRALSCYNISTR